LPATQTDPVDKSGTQNLSNFTELKFSTKLYEPKNSKNLVIQKNKKSIPLPSEHTTFGFKTHTSF
jgi:hypothetical protein